MRGVPKTKQRSMEIRREKVRRRAGQGFMNLDLSGLELEKLPEWATDFDLIELDLHDNRLTTLPDTLGLFSGTLQVLDLRRNPFTALPEVVRELTELRELYLCQTRITELPPWIDELGQLTCVQAQGCRLSVPSGLSFALWPQGK